ncbi:MAG: LysE family translocator [Undibacterium sp.]|nr:LysE family translocator [Undibacterium sp.]
MTETHHLWLYFLVIFGVIVLPGMDMAYVIGSSMKGGHRSGFAAIAGIVVGGIIHFFIGATGLSAVFALLPWIYPVMLIAGSAYIAWLGIGLLRLSSLSGPVAGQGGSNISKSFMGALATCLLNPKAYVFILAIFPQFIHREYGSVWVQTSILSIITAATQVLVYGCVVFIALQSQRRLAAKPHSNVLLAKAIGVLLIITAILTLNGGLSQMG